MRPTFKILIREEVNPACIHAGQWGRCAIARFEQRRRCHTSGTRITPVASIALQPRFARREHTPGCVPRARPSFARRLSRRVFTPGNGSVVRSRVSNRSDLVTQAARESPPSRRPRRTPISPGVNTRRVASHVQDRHSRGELHPACIHAGRNRGVTRSARRPPAPRRPPQRRRGSTGRYSTPRAAPRSCRRT